MCAGLRYGRSLYGGMRVPSNATIRHTEAGSKRLSLVHRLQILAHCTLAHALTCFKP